MLTTYNYLIHVWSTYNYLPNVTFNINYNTLLKCSLVSRFKYLYSLIDFKFSGKLLKSLLPVYINDLWPCTVLRAGIFTLPEVDVRALFKHLWTTIMKRAKHYNHTAKYVATSDQGGGGERPMQPSNCFSSGSRSIVQRVPTSYTLLASTTCPQSETGLCYLLQDSVQYHNSANVHCRPSI